MLVLSPHRFGKLEVVHGGGLIIKDFPDLTQDGLDEIRFFCTFL